MKDLESIKQELRNDLLGESYWGDLAKKFGTQLKNYALTGNSNISPQQYSAIISSGRPSQVYQKIVAAAKQFSTKFIADFKQIAATLNDPNLISYADKFQVTLTEVKVNVATGAGSTSTATNNSKGIANKTSENPSPKGDKKGESKPQAPAPAAPAATPAPKPQMPPEFTDLKKSVSDFMINLGTIAGINTTKPKDALDGILMSNLITVDEKKKLKTFIQKHLQWVKYLRAKINKQPVKPAPATAAPVAAPATPVPPLGSKLNEYSTVENWRSKGQPVVVMFFDSSKGKNVIKLGTISEPQNTQVTVKLDYPVGLKSSVVVPWKYVKPIALGMTDPNKE